MYVSVRGVCMYICVCVYVCVCGSLCGVWMHVWGVLCVYVCVCVWVRVCVWQPAMIHIGIVTENSSLSGVWSSFLSEPFLIVASTPD